MPGNAHEFECAVMLIILFLLIIVMIVVVLAAGAAAGAMSGILLAVLAVPALILFYFVASDIIELIFDLIVFVLKMAWRPLTWPIRAVWRKLG